MCNIWTWNDCFFFFFFFLSHLPKNSETKISFFSPSLSISFFLTVVKWKAIHMEIYVISIFHTLAVRTVKIEDSDCTKIRNENKMNEMDTLIEKQWHFHWMEILSMHAIEYTLYKWRPVWIHFLSLLFLFKHFQEKKEYSGRRREVNDKLNSFVVQYVALYALLFNFNVWFRSLVFGNDIKDGNRLENLLIFSVGECCASRSTSTAYIRRYWLYYPLIYVYLIHKMNLTGWVFIENVWAVIEFAMNRNWEKSKHMHTESYLSHTNVRSH